MKNLLFFIMLINYKYSFSQNVIPNYSFEDLKNNHADKPTLQDHLQYLDQWENLNTSDLFSNEPGKFVGRFDPVNSISGPNCYTMGPYTMPANHQNKYIGFGPCEGAKVKFMNGYKLEKNQWAKVKLKYAFRGLNTTTNLKIAISSTLNSGNVYDANNNSNQNNNNDCACLALPGTFEMKNYPLTTASDKVPGVWYELETYILNTQNASLDCLYLLGDNTTSNIYGFSTNYIFIDDVSLEILDFCDHPCAWSNGPVEHGTLPNAMVGNCDNCIVEVDGIDELANRFTLLNKNVNIFKFTVFNTWGQEVNKTELYSLSPLADAGYSDWLFSWNGFANLDNTWVDPGTLNPDSYFYRIEMQACNKGGYVNEVKWLALLGVINPPAIQPPLPNVYSSETCCPNEKYIQNTIFQTSQNYKHKVDEFILIGPDVNPSPFVQNGEVIFQPRTNVLFEAGNYVEFIPGASIYNGPIDIDMDLSSVLNNNVTVDIKPCISPNRNSGSPRDNFQYSNEKFIINNLNPLSNNNLIELYPTVTSNIFKLKSSLFNIEKVEIIDNNGKVVQTEIKSFKETEIDCNALSSGFYFVKLFLENGSIAFKKVVKVDLD